MANIPIDAVFNQTIYAKGRVNKYSFPGGNVISVIPSGGVIGKIYSYVLHNGKVFWMVDDLFGTQTFFIEHNPNLITLPNKDQILNDLAKKAEAQKLEDKGIIQYNIDKYLPYIVGGAIAIAALPTILQTGSKINGMKKEKKDNLKTLLLIGGAAALLLYLTKKKTKAGKPIIEVIDEGFVNEIKPANVPAASGVVLQDSFGNQSAIDAVLPNVSAMTLTTGGGGGGGSRYIEFVGPFKAKYQQPEQTIISGKAQKGNLGKLKTC